MQKVDGLLVFRELKVLIGLTWIPSAKGRRIWYLGDFLFSSFEIICANIFINHWLQLYCRISKILSFYVGKPPLKLEINQNDQMNQTAKSKLDENCKNLWRQLRDFFLIAILINAKILNL